MSEQLSTDLSQVVEEAEHEVDVVEAWSPPVEAKVPEGATFVLGADDGYCRVLHVDGRRCQGVRMHETGLCPPHSGRSRILDDPRGMQARSAQGKVRARERRAMLVSNGVNPRLAAREAAIRRSDAVVRALVDDPLDDDKLSTMQRQKAVLEMLDATFPLAQVSTEIEIPATAEGVAQLGWVELQQLAARVLPELGEGGTQVVHPPPDVA